jgi:putative acetyltransferase
MSPVTIQRLAWTHPDAIALRSAQQQEIDGLRPIGPGDGTEPVGCGGLRPLAEQGLPEQAEVKRMYVVPSRRGRRGVVARGILEALEGVARENGWVALKVETSMAMAQARRFYEKSGYVSCEVFGGYVGSGHSVCYEKRLC